MKISLWSTISTSLLLATGLLPMAATAQRGHGDEFQERDTIDSVVPTLAPVVRTEVPTAEIIESSEDGSERDPTIQSGSRVSTAGIIGLALGSSFVILAALAARRRRQRQQMMAANAAPLDSMVSTDAGDAAPV